MTRRVLMVASENDALQGGKVGGIGDVVRDIPVALVELGINVDVVTPGYQFLSRLPGAEKHSTFDFDFAGKKQTATLFKIPPKKVTPGVCHWALEFPDSFYGEAAGIYFNDGSTKPFATDATKFACFSAAVATAIINGAMTKPDVIHLHDWHSALLLLLRRDDPAFHQLKSIPCVYTIHNLALQGIRPLKGDVSSLQSWFPELKYHPDDIIDPRAQNCINPMRTGINLADRVHVVSPTYAKEIRLPSNPDMGFIGGEGLDQDLARAHAQNKVVGILNGCTYPDNVRKHWPRTELINALDREMMTLITQKPSVDSTLYAAHHNFSVWANKMGAGLLITSVGRITDQKIAILKQQLPSGKSALETLLLELGNDGVFVLLGNGDPELEQFLTRVCAQYRNFIFIKGYSESLSTILYQAGDLFLMPSSFEPCGISQMLAMRAGQPCLVHAVGGLKDTVIDGVSSFGGLDSSNGFSFDGASVKQQAINMLRRFIEVKHLKRNRSVQYKAICDNARKARFSWKHSAEQYVSKLYRF